jgi:spermidine/putrescine transport system substrate-binding protein
MLLAVMMTLVLVACGTGTPAPANTEPVEGAPGSDNEVGVAPGTGDNVLNVYNWSTYIAPEMIPAFEEKYGVKVNYDIFADNDELLAKIQPGNPGYDIIVPSDYMVAIMIQLELLEKLDKSQLTNFKNIDPLFINPQFDANNDHCVPYQWGTTGLGYNIKETGKEIDSYEVMFNGEFTGKISWLSDSRSTMAIALIYLGYDPNTTNPDEINEAAELLKSTKKDIAAFAPDTGQDLLNQGEVDIAYEYSGDIFQLMAENPDIRYVIPKEGSTIWTDNLCIPVGAPHPDLAHKFIDFILDAQIGADLSNYTAYGTPNAASLPLIDEELRNNPAIYPPDDVKARLHFLYSLGEADALYDEAWTDIGVSQ